MAADDRDVLPNDVEPLHYNLSIYNLNRTEFTYSGTVAIDVLINGETKSISLNVKELELGEAVIVADQTKTQFEYKSTSIDVDKKRERATINFPDQLPTGVQAKLTIHFTGILNNKMAGFYRSEYKTQDTNEVTHMFSTQFESCDARQAFPCFDEPNLKATFDFAITIPTTWTALSNMPVVSSKPPADGSKASKTSSDTELKVVTFATSPKMSTYLLAWACGDFEYVETFTERTYNGAAIPVRVYTTKGLKEQGQFALENAAKVVDYFSEVFDIDYPLPKVDMLAVHEFSHGAMENWGLITYRTTAVLYDEGKSDPRYKNRVAYVVAHELAHQWFGNLVTMDWWNELWLNEGFATWVGWLAVDKFYPDWDVWGQFVAESMQTGFQLDSLRSSHPIEVPVRDALEVDQIFDHISYLKGSSVIRMLSSALGIEVFLKGVSNYLKKHKYANAQTDDLWSALSEASGKDVNAIMDNWIKAIGFPVLDVTETADSLTIQQKRFLSTGDVKPEDDTTTWWVPLGLTKESLSESAEGSVDALTAKETTISSVNTEYYKLNLNQNGFFRVNYPVERFAKLGATIGNFSVADRIGLVADAQALALSGDGTTQSLLSLLEGLKHEDNFLVWQTVVTALSAVRSVFGGVSPEIKEGLKKFSLDLYTPAAEKLGWEFKESDDFLTTQLRGLIIGAAASAGHESIIAEAKRQFAAYFAGDSSAIHPALKLRVFRIGITEGGKDEYDLVWNEYLKATSPDGKEITLQSLGRVKDDALIVDYLEKMLGDKIPTQNTHYTSSSLATNAEARPLLWKFVKERWDDIFKLLSGNMVLLDRFVRVTLNKFSDETILEDLKAFFEPKDQRGYDRAVRIAIDSVSGNVIWKKRDEKAVEEWLRSKGYLA
ncbi:Laeverin [Dactylella cylindrospora]|nr:Laeverin [Dactylella cylindrospora]